MLHIHQLYIMFKIVSTIAMDFIMFILSIVFVFVSLHYSNKQRKSYEFLKTSNHFSVNNSETEKENL